MARAKSKNIKQMAQVLVATYLEVMGVDYVASDGVLLVGGQILDVSNPEAICSEEEEIARAELERVLAPVGKPPLPPRRSKKVSRASGNDPDGTVWRENQLRRLPNPPPWVFAQFESVCRSVASRFLYLNKKACDRLGLGLDDLMQYTHIWLILYWGRYRVLRQGDDNFKLFRTFLAQRFAEFHAQIDTKPRLPRRCPSCKAETKAETCCETQTIENPLLNKPAPGGLRTRRQMTSPIFDMNDFVNEGAVTNPTRTTASVVPIHRVSEVRLGTLSWSRILAALEGRDESHRLEILHDLAGQEYSREISVLAAAEIAKSETT